MTSKLISLGSFTLDLDRFCVRGPLGEVGLRRKSFEVLRYLLEHRGQVTGKQELLEAVWPNVTVGDDSLAQCISEIRRAIGDDQQRIIKTVPRRGYLANVQPDPSEPGVIAELVQPIAPERRQLTIIVCNMLDAMALAKRLDPEEFREVIAAVTSRIQEVVKLHGGTVGEHSPDGLVAYFGYPRAHEADAERAVRAGLALIRATGELNVKALRGAPQVRTAVATGLVVVENESGKATGPTVVGEAPILASRLLRLASPGSVVISAGTRQLLGSLFDYRELADAELQGSIEPAGYQILSESAVASRFDALRSRRTRLVGREEEVGLLWRRWEQAKKGEGRVVLVTGEPGIGKSRLTRALQERLSSEHCTQLLYHCSPYHQDSALYPIIGEIIRSAGIERDDTPHSKLDKLEALLEHSIENRTEDIPLYAALLSIPGGDRYQLPKLTAQHMKTRTMSLLLARLKQLGAHQPVLMVFEDVHWIDPTSLELLSLAIDEIKTARILILATARPEFTPPWPLHRHTSNMILNRLDKVEAEALVAGMTDGKSLPREFLDQILARSDGIPLFIEELTKTVLDSGLLRQADGRYELTGALPPVAIPSTLHASLLARLDRLGWMKDVAEIGAVIGREFSYSLIAAVANHSERDLLAALAQLVNAELIFQRGVPPDATYQFKHALVQGAAYASLVRSRRQQLHGLIARTLVKQFPETAEVEPELVAHHYAAADVVDAAIDYWQKAAERASRTSAYAEAAKHLTNAVTSLQQLPSTTLRQHQELGLQIALGSAFIASQGWGASETGAAYARAHELSRLTEDASQLPKILAGRFVHYHTMGDVRHAQSAAHELLAFARERGDAAAEAMAHRTLGDSLIHVGDLQSANAHLEEALRILDPHSLPFFVGEDVKTATLVFLSLCLTLQGHVSAAEERLQEAIARARSLDHTFTLTFALNNACRIKCHLLDHTGLVQHLDCLQALATEHRIKFMQENAAIFRGWAMLLEDQIEEGSSLLKSSVEGDVTSRARKNMPFHGAMLATAYQRTGRVEDGLTLIRKLLRMVDRSGNRYVEAELYRVKAELLISSAKLAEAEEALERGLAIAREQQARIYEVRIATNLAKIWRDRGQSAKAHSLLAPICDSFGRISLRDLEGANEVLRTLNKRPTPTVALG